MKNLGVLVLVCLLMPVFVEAAALSIDPATPTLSRGDAVKLSVRLDTDEESGECINVVEGVVAFTGPIMPVDVSTGNSIMSIWVEPPVINQAANQITFAGGIPNGYCGRIEGDPRLTNNVFDIIVRADAAADPDGENRVASVYLTEQTLVYLNDGNGTSLAPVTYPSTITVGPELGAEVQDPWKNEIDADTIPPQPFSIYLERDRLAFTGEYYISFNTTDKQTGIDRYEVIEEPIESHWTFNWGRADAPWRVARSPYVLDDQSLNSVIRVKAVDKAGNEYISTLVPDEELRTLSFNQFLSLVLFGAVVVLLAAGAWFVLARRRLKRQGAMLAQLDEDANNYQPPTY